MTDTTTPDTTTPDTPDSPETPPSRDADGPGPRSIHQTIIAVMRDVRAVGKDGFNEQQKFKFRGIDGVMNAVGPAMREHGLMVFPLSVEKEMSTGTSRAGGALHMHRLHVIFRFANEDGDYLDVEIPSESMDSSDKGTAKAMSVALRIALLQVLALPTEDRDPDEDYHQMAAPQAHNGPGNTPSSPPGAPAAVNHAPVPNNWREYVTRAEEEGNMALLEQMEASAAAHGNTEARTGIASARLRVKRAAAAAAESPTPEEAQKRASDELGATPADTPEAAQKDGQTPSRPTPEPHDSMPHSDTVTGSVQDFIDEFTDPFGGRA